MKQSNEVESGILQFAILMGIQMGVRLDNAGIMNDVALNKHHKEVDIAILEATKYIMEHSGSGENADFKDANTKFARDVHLTMHIEETVNKFRKILKSVMNKKTVCPRCKSLVPKGNFCEVCGLRLKTGEEG